MRKLNGLLIITTVLVAMFFSGCEVGGFVSSDSSKAVSTKAAITVSDVTASSDDGNEPENTLDGDLDTRWSAEGEGEYITYDLGSSQTVTDVQIAFYKGDERTADFEIWAGDSVSDLSQILDLTTSSGDTEDLESYDVTDTTAQYVRIVCYGNENDDWNSITEVELENNSDEDATIDDSTDESDETTTAEEGELSISDVDASADDGNVAANTIDDDYDTRWSAYGSGEYITYDLGDEQTVGSIKIAFYNGDSRNAYFYVQAGSSLSDLSNVSDDLASSGSSTELEHFDLDDVSARYVRIVGEGNSDNSWNSITEVEIWSDGYDPEDGTDDSTDTTDDESDDSTTDSTYPCGVLGISEDTWKINSFVGDPDDDPTYYDDIADSGADYDTYEDDYYFYTDGEWVYFKCYRGLEGSSSSSNPRVELRERDGEGDEIYWTNEGTNTMEWTVRVDQLSTDADGDEGCTCFGQIHGPGDSVDDVIRVQFKGDASQTSGEVSLKISGYITEEVLGGSVILSEDYCDENGFTYNTYYLDTEYTFMIEYNSDDYVTLYCNGDVIFTQKMDTDEDDNYFKVGNYVQQSKGADYDGSSAIVAVKDLTITHED
ncbi:MAG: polysaccharide lyase family 7 protein [Spirochaetales bacterium]|nr:polysaccharide lyase family 7 protein [Spirochaetales bacterium]